MTTKFIRDQVSEAEHNQAAHDADVTRRNAPECTVPGCTASADGLVDRPASFVQKRLWRAEQQAPGQGLNNLAALFKITGRAASAATPAAGGKEPNERCSELPGALDPAPLQQAAVAVVKRHAVLCSNLVESHGGLVQRINTRKVDAGHVLDFQLTDLSEAGDQHAAILPELLQKERRHPFDLTDGVLLRLHLIKTGRETLLLSLCCHRAVADAQSLELIAGELLAAWTALNRGEELAATAAPAQYADYTGWQLEWLKGASLRQELAFWQSQLRDLPPVHGLPLDRPRTPRGVFPAASFHQRLDRARTQALQQVCTRHEVSLFVLLHTAFALLVGRFSNSRDIVTGTPAPLRDHPDTRRMIGNLDNHWVLRTRLEPDHCFSELLASNARMIRQARQHPHIPVELLMAELPGGLQQATQPGVGRHGPDQHQVDQHGVDQPWSHHPVFQLYFAMSGEATADPGYTTPAAACGWHIEALEVAASSTDYDLDLRVTPADDELHLAWCYNRDIFDAARIEQMAACLAVLLDSVTRDAQDANVTHSIDRLPLLPARELALLQQWNATTLTVPAVAGAHELFEQQAEQHPHNIALVCADARVSYAALNRQANRIAHRLLALGVTTEERVGVCLARGPELVAALLGVMKAGAAYVPLDPEYPRDRLQYMLADAGAAWMICSDDVTGAAERVCETHPAAAPRGKPLGLVAITDPALAQCREDNPRIALDRDQLAYVLYTSGSTGRPKGVAIRHESVLALLAWSQAEFGAELLDGVLASTSICFDLSVFELFAPLSTGGRVVLAQNALSLLNFDQWDDVRLINTVPSAINALVTSRELPATVRVVNLAGEALTRQTVEQVLARSSVERVYNLYGPSEDTTYSTGSRVADGSRTATGVALAGAPHQPPAIGRPVNNSQAYVLNEVLEPVPVGVSGELYLGGAGVARGYLGRPGLTAERFLPDPFAGTPGARMYRTGDLARHCNDGELDYIGRIDHQVKLRGFRIELGEIESRLCEHTAVTGALVQVLDGELGQQLVGYVTADKSVSATDLQEALRHSLPAYMVPAAILCLDAFPQTANGKVDRQRLPVPDWSRYRQDYVAPRNATERTLAAMYEDLLGVAQVGVDDSFFKLGGHSLLAIQLISRVRRAFAVELPMPVLFDYATVAALAQQLPDYRQQRVLPPIQAQDKTGRAPASYAQQRLWFLDRLESGSAHYNLPYAFRVQGPLDVAALTRALNRIIRRHEVLRSRFEQGEDGVYQYVDQAADLVLEQRDLSDCDAAQQTAEVQRLIEAEAHRAFDLNRDLLVRAQLLRLHDRAHVVSVTIHHIAADGWSARVFFRELSHWYAAYCDGSAGELPELALQYSDYAHWQRARLQEGTRQAQLDYWRQQLAGAAEVHRLPLDYPRPQQPARYGVVHTQQLGAALSEQLAALCRQHGATLFMVLHTAFAVLLGRYSRQQDIVTGTTIAGRDQLATEPLIGYFVNTVVLRTRFADDQSFSEVLKHNKQTILDAFAHQHLPFDRLVEALRPQRHLNHSPVIQIMFTMLDDEGEELTLAGAEVSDISRQDDTLNFDLRLSVRQHGEAVSLEWVYSPQLFSGATIQRMADNFACLLHGISAQPHQAIRQLPYISPQETAQLLQHWNPPPAAIASDASLHRAFEALAANRPDAVAVDCAGHQLSYRALNQRANQLAHYLIAHGVAPDTVVGLCVHPSLEMVVAILGIIKAGGAYLPLDANNPQQRLAYILDDAQARLVVTHSELADKLPRDNCALLCLDDVAWRHHPAATTTANPDVAVSARHLLYVIYTSGSTGLPKGVLVEHGQLCHFQHVFAEQLDYLGVTDGAPWLWSSAYAFDASFKGILTLNRGGRVVIAAAAQRADASQLAALLLHHRIPVFNGMPLLADQVREQVLAQSGHGVHLILGGDEIDTALWHKIADYCAQHQCRAINAYGPTELTINATWAAMEQAAPGSIGHAVSNSLAYVLDDQAELLPIGVPGELYVGGNGVARGYHNRPALTAQRFVANPFNAEVSRLYRTGDRVRRLADGSFEFLGRVDQQVKIRGFRIELGEIETRIKQHPGVAQVRVLVRVSPVGGKQLAAYIVPVQSGAENVLDNVRQALQQGLPDYMVPSVWQVLDALPLSANGKVDNAALLVLEAADTAPAPEDRGPRSELEQQLAQVWQDTLEVNAIDVEANFFELGGHSLLAIKLINQIRETLGVELDLQDVFEHPSIASMAAILHHSNESQLPPIVVADRRGRLPLSYVQQRLRFIDQLEGGSSQYNVPWAFRLRGPLKAAALQAALHTLVQRHEILRTTYGEAGADYFQIIHDDAELPLRQRDFSALAASQRAAALQQAVLDDAQQAFDLSRDVLLRATLVTLGADDYALLINMHHIVTDAWSAGIFFTELRTLYAAYREGHSHPLPPLPVQYADYACWQRDWAQGTLLSAQLDYWTAQLAGIPALHSLPLDFPRPEQQSFKGKTHYVTLDDATAAQIRATMQAQQVTLFMLMQTVFSILLGRVSGEDDVVIGTPVAGRTHTDIEGLMGCFVNTLTLRNHCGHNPTFAQALAANKQTVLEAFSHQHVPFEMLVEALGVERNLSYSPIFQIAFATETDQQAQLTLPGLQLEVIAQEHSILKFDLELVIVERDDQLLLKWDYNTDLFAARRIEHLADSYVALLQAALAQPETAIADLPLLSTQARTRLLEHHSRRDAALPWDQREVLSSLPQRIAEQARRAPTAAALDIAGVVMDYRGLNEQANRLAAYLREQGVVNEALVGIGHLPPAQQAIAQWAVLKAGGACVPLWHLSEDQQQAACTALNLCLTLGGSTASSAESVVTIHSGDIDLSAYPHSDPELSPRAGHHVAWVLWRADQVVEIEHQTLLNLFDDAAYPALQAGQVMAVTGDAAALATRSFLLLSTLCAGACYRVIDTAAVISPAARDDVDTLVLGAQDLATVAATQADALAGVKRVVVAADAASDALAAILHAGAPVSLLGVNGADHGHGVIRWQHITRINRRGLYPIVLSRNLARELDYSALYLLDQRLEPVPVGAVGEVYQGGGALRDDAGDGLLSPFHGGEQLRPSGQWARWVDTASGLQLQEVERIEDAVLIRGQRVSPAAVAAALCATPAVADAWVTTQSTTAGAMQLVAYLVLATRADDVHAQLRGVQAAIQAVCRVYEIPEVYVPVAALPRQHDGAVDKQQLPDADLYGLRVDTYVAPRTTQEQALCTMWQALLGVSRIGVADDFFLLGGHSLLATRLVSRIRQELQIELPLRVLFEHSILGELAAVLDDYQQDGVLPPIARADRQHPLPVSFAQGRLWFIDRLEGGSSHYNMPFHFRCQGAFNAEAFQRAINDIVARHEVLRTHFVQQGDEIYQLIQNRSAVPVAIDDLTALSAAEREAEVHRRSQADADHRFDLSRDRLLRVQVLRLAADEHAVLLNLHHIAADGWSMDIFFRELSAIYAAYCRGEALSLPPLAVQYADYASWQRQWLQGAVLQQQVDYWRQQLAECPPVHSLPLDRERPAQQSFAGSTYHKALDRELLAGLNRLCRHHDATLFMVLETAFAVLLGRFSREPEIVIGTPIAGRSHGDTEAMIGFFVNMLAVRTRLNGSDCFSHLLEVNKKTILDAFGHQAAPFEMLVEALQPERSLQHSPLFQVLFALQQQAHNVCHLEGLQTQRIRPAENVAKFDLELFITEQASGLQASWNYNTDLFHRSTIEQLADSYAVLLQALVQDPDTALDRLPLLHADQRAALLQQHSCRDAWQPAAERRPRHSIPQRFSEQAARHADSLALDIAGVALDYRTLNRQANQLAHYLQTRGVGAETLVGIALPPSVAQVIAQLAVLKAGGAYVPLPPAAGDQTGDVTGLSLLVMPHARAAAVPVVAWSTLELDDYPAGDPELLPRSAHQLACVLPAATDAAVAIEHHRLLALFDEPAYPGVGNGQVGAVIGTDDLGLNTFLLWQTLCQGGCYQYAAGDFLSGELSSADFKHWLQDVDTLVLDARAVARVAAQHTAVLAELPHLVVAADVDAQALGAILAAGAPRQVFSVNQVAAAQGLSRWQRVAKINRRGIYPIALSANLARKHDYTALYLLDHNLQPVPVGAVGEVYQAGARLRRADQPLIASPFQAGEYLRKTGAWARWVSRAEGAQHTWQLQAVERLAGAVLIRGKRISTVAVARALLNCPQISDAWVTADRAADGQRQLLAFVVLRGMVPGDNAAGTPMDHTTDRTADAGLHDVHSSLHGQLSVYERPALYVPVAAIPRRDDGSVDQTALPDAAVYGITVDTYVAPRTAQEQSLCAIWQDLLGVQRIGTADDFFLLGGHSLLATRLISRIRQDLNIELPLRVLFEHSTVRELAAALAEHEQTVVLPPITAADRGQPLPVSFAQGRLWFIDKLEGGSSHYNMPFHFRLHGVLNVTALERAIQTIACRHEVLRTRFVQQGAEVYQVIRPPTEVMDNLKISVHDLSMLSAGQQHEVIQHRSHEDAKRLYNLSQDLLLRVTVLRLSGDEQVVLLNMHHIASDGWSMEIFFRELSTLYAAYRQQQEIELPPLAVQYADYAGWQRNWLQGDVLQQQLGYWQQQLADSPPVHSFPLDHARPRQQDFRGKTYSQYMDTALAARIKDYCQANNITLFMFLQTAFALFVSRYSGVDDVVMGTPVAGRLHKDVEPMIGFFINMLALRNDLSGNPSFSELLARNRGMILDAFAHQHIPFEMLVEELNPQRNLSHSPLFQLAFAMPTQEQMKVALQDLEYQPLRLREVPSKFDLSLTVIEEPGAAGDTRLRVNTVYCGVLFEHATIERMCANYIALLHNLLDQPQRAISEIPFIAEAEQQQLLTQWQAGQVKATPQCLQQRFEQQAVQTPERVALVVGEQQLSYRALNRRANQLAAYLIEQGVKPDTLVGLFTTPSVETVIGILGILKAGGAYVPLDTAQPEQRLATIVQDAGVEWVLTQSALLDQLPISGQSTLCLDQQQTWQRLTAYRADNPSTQALGLTPHHLIYAIYTSGSSGRPKGVLVEHASVDNFHIVFQQQLQALNLNPDSGWLWTASYAFDASVKSLIAMNLGYRVVMATATQRTDAEQIAAMLQAHRITVFNGMPQLVDYVLEAWHKVHDDGTGVAALNLILSGDQVPEPLWHKVAAYCREHGRRALNAYGPTELTVNATYGVIDGHREPHIGSPVTNSRVFVLDEQQQLQPIGASGELCVGGDLLARGYLNQPGLQAEKFVHVTWPDGRSERVYRTGDRVRWRREGELEFLGRIDRQVKLHGFRIELGDIETQLMHHNAVRQAHVLVRDSESGEKQLAAFIVLQPAANSEAMAAVKRALRERVPDYMVPALWLSLEALPLQHSGKVDRKALLQLAAERNRGSEAAAPRSPLEQQLCAIWQEVLQVEAVGTQDNFFNLGGFSLLAIKLLNDIQDALGVMLDLQDLFEHPDVASLAQLIATQPGSAADDQKAGGEKNEVSAAGQAPPASDPRPELARIARTTPLLPSFAQQRLWFIDQLEGGSAQYNMPMIYRLSGPLNHAALQQALTTIVQRHEVLRTNFINRSEQATDDQSKGAQTVALIRAADSVPLTRHDLSALEPDARDDELQRLVQADSRGAFDLQRDLLLRVQVIRLDESTHWLLCNMHHIAADGWSMGVFFRELGALYNAYCQGLPNPLPELPVQYLDYAHWQRVSLQGAWLQQHVDYWRGQLADCPPVHSLPLDHERPAAQSFNGRVHRQRLDAGLSAALKALCQQYEVTWFMLLETTFALLVGRYSGERDVVIGTPIAGRSHSATEPLIGFFVNMLALRTRFNGEDTFAQVLARNKQTILDGFSHQHCPFEMLVEQLQPERSRQHTPIFQISFALYNNERSALQLDGLEQQSLDSGQGIIKFDLELFAGHDGDELLLAWNYNTDLFADHSIHHLAAAYGHLLRALLAQPATAVEALPLAAGQSQQTLVQRHSRRDAWQPVKDRAALSSLVQRIDEQARRQPQAVAISIADETLDYQTLNRRANRLAHYLRAHGLGTEQRVGITLPLSVKRVVAQLAVMKAGGAFVLLHDLSAEQRQAAMSAAAVQWLLTMDAEAVVAAGADVRIITLDGTVDHALAACADGCPAVPHNHGHHLACAVYSATDDSAVAIEHQSLLDLFNDPAYPAVAEGQVACVVGDDARDSDSFLLWQTLCNGGCYRHKNRWHSAGHHLASAHTVFLADSALAAVAAQPTDALREVAHLVVANGFDAAVLNTILQTDPACSVLSVDHPAIAGGTSRWQQVARINRRGMYPIVLSRLLAREHDYTALYVLDRYLQPLPVGAVGQVYQGGYWLQEGDQPLSASPFHSGEQLRPGGQWARWVADGDGLRLERVARYDDAVLIRGKRVKPQNVAEHIQAQATVNDAWVTSQVDANGQRQLVAYVVCADVAAASESALRNLQAALQREVSAYELPAIYVPVSTIARCADNRVDQQALPAAAEHGLRIDSYVAPRTEREQTLCVMWQDLLAVERIGIEDDFFLLGGHSLLATRLISRIRQALNTELPLRVLFENPTVRTLAAALDEQGQAAVLPSIAKATARTLDDESLEGEVF